jgi:hypothetical protein
MGAIINFGFPAGNNFTRLPWILKGWHYSMFQRYHTFTSWQSKNMRDGAELVIFMHLRVTIFTVQPRQWSPMPSILPFFTVSGLRIYRVDLTLFSGFHLLSFSSSLRSQSFSLLVLSTLHRIQTNTSSSSYMNYLHNHEIQSSDNHIILTRRTPPAEFGSGSTLGPNVTI